MLTACSIVSVDQKTRYRDAEGYFEPTLFEQIKTGETSRTWLSKHFGRPWFSEVDGLAEYPPNVHIDTWRFAREQQKNTRVFLLFRSRKLEQQYEYLHVVSEDDTVMRVWRDELATVDIHRLMAAMGYPRNRAAVKSSSMTAEPLAAHPGPDVKTDPVPPPADLVVEDVSRKEPAQATPATPTAAPPAVTSP
jgi:hypothetical protein